MLRVSRRVGLGAHESDPEDEGGDGAERELRPSGAVAGGLDPALSHGGSVGGSDEKSM